MAPRRPVPPGGPAGRRPGAARTAPGTRAAGPRAPARGTPARAASARPPAAGRDVRAAPPARIADPRPPGPPRPRGTAARPGRGLRRPPVVRPVTMLSGVLVILALLIAPYVRPWLAQRSQLAQGRAEVVQLQSEVARLQAERDRWDDPAYIRAQARARLGLLNPGEVGYVRLDPSAPASAGGRSGAGAQPPPGRPRGRRPPPPRHDAGRCPVTPAVPRDPGRRPVT